MLKLIVLETKETDLQISVGQAVLDLLIKTYKILIWEIQGPLDILRF